NAQDRTARHRAGATREQQERRLPERKNVHDDPAIVHGEQHANRGDVHRAGAESETDQDGATDHARFLAMRSPSRPCGRKISTMISSVKAIRSRSWYGAGIPMSFRNSVGPTDSTMPRKKPPSIAPGILPMPLSTAAPNALMPGVKPIRKYICL